MLVFLVLGGVGMVLLLGGLLLGDVFDGLLDSFDAGGTGLTPASAPRSRPSASAARCSSAPSARPSRRSPAWAARPCSAPRRSSSPAR